MAFKIAELFAELKIKDAPFNTKMKRVRKNLGLTSKNITAFGNRLKRTGKQLAVFAGIAAGAFALLAKKVGDFDTTFQQTLNLLTEADQVRFGETLRTGVRKLAVEFGRNLGDVTKGLFDLISAGATAEDALNQLRVGLKLSVASAVSAGTAIDALTTVQNAFNLSATEMANTSDLLFKINKAGKTTIEKLSASIGNVAADAFSAGVSIEDFGAAISTLTFKGIKTEQTMTKLKALFNELGKKGFVKNANEALQRYGITFTTTELKTNGLVKTLEKLGKLTKLQRQDLTANSEALSAINTLLAAMSKLQSDVNGQLDRSGTVNKAAADSAKTLGEQLNRLTASLNEMFIEIGTNVVPAFTKAIPVLAQATKTFSNFLAGVLKGEGIIGGFADIFVTAIQGFKGLFEFLDDGSLRVGEFSASYLTEMGKVLEVNAKLEKSLKELNASFKSDQAKFRQKQVKGVEDILNKISKVSTGKLDTTTDRTIEQLKEITELRLKVFETQRKFLEKSSGTGGFIRTGRDKEQELTFIDKQEKKIKEAAKARLADIRKVLVEDIAVQKLGDKLKEAFEFGKGVFENAKNELKIPFNNFKKTVGDFIERSKIGRRFEKARTEQERQARLEAISPAKAEQLFERGLQGIKQEFSPQELLGKISETIIKSAEKARFTTIEDFQKGLQLSFLDDDKKDDAIKDNTKKVKENTDALKKVVVKLAVIIARSY